VPDKHEAFEILPPDLVDNVVDMSRETDRIAGQVRAFTDARESRCHDIAPLGSQSIANTSPAPAAVPGTMHEHDRRTL
jgi:hypothetical protein